MEQTFFIAIFGVFVFVTAWTSARYIYFLILGQKKLKPNCLLTRAPLVLLTKPVSPWKFWSNENQIFFRLKEHGYKVLWAQSPKELDTLQNQLFHLIDNLSQYPNENAILERVQTYAEQDHLQSIR